MLSPEATSVLQQYEKGNLSNGELAEWLVQTEYDSALAQEERDTLAALRLIVVEEAEGRRSNEDVLEAVAGILAFESPGGQVLTVRTSSSTWWDQRIVTGAASRARRAGISP